MRRAGRTTVVVLLASGLAILVTAQAPAPPTMDARRSGTTFLSAELRRQSADDGANPGMLWVERGEAMWRVEAGRSGRACVTCHAEPRKSMKGVAARYPRIDPATGELRSIELQVNACRIERLGAERLAWESDGLLSLTAFIAYLARGVSIAATTDPRAAPHLERGRSLFYERQGQLNLACAHCHEDNWGKRLRGDVISQGHPSGFPIYRLEWQTLGSLQRRLRACSLGVRAEVQDFGAADYLALELYLAMRASGMPLEGPAIRK